MALTLDQLQIQIVADSGKATTAIENLIGRLETLQGKLNGLGSAGKKAGNGLSATASGAAKAATATDKHRNSTDKASKSTKGFTDKLAQQISKYRTLMGAFKSAANMMGSWFKESNEYIETVNLFNITMGDAAKSARKYAETVQEAMGIDSKDFMQYQGVFKNLTAGFGVVEEDANKMSKNLTQLSYDMASFFNTDVEAAFDKLSSAMSGQVKGLREFGIDTTVATLQEYALSKGIETKVRNMTQAEKAMLRYNYILEKSTHMQGDMARTLITPANALRVLESQLTRMKRALGNIISVLITQFIPYVQAVVQVIEEAANAIAKFFGFDAGDFEEASKGVVNSWGDAEDGVDDYTESLKKAKKQMMGFDELNIISNPDSGSSTSDSSGGLNGMKPLEYDFLKGLDTSKVDKIYDTVKKVLNPLKKIADYLYDYKDTLTVIVGVLTAFSIVKWVKNINNALAGLKFVNYFLDGFKLIKAMGGNVFQSFVGGLDNVRYNLTKIQKAAVVAVAGVVEFFAIKDSVKALVTGCDDVGAKLVTIGGVAGVAAIAMYAALGPVGLAIAAVIGVAGAIAGVITGLYDAGKAAYESSEDFKIMQASIETTQAVSDRCAESIDAMKSAVDRLDESSLNYAIAKNLTTEIFDLNEKAQLSQYELAQIKQKVEVLNGLNIDGLHLSIDETTGRVIQTRQETEKLIEALEKEARLEAMKDILVEAYKAQYQAIEDNKTAYDEYTMASDAVNETQKKLADTAWYEFKKRGELNAQLEKQKEALDSAKTAFDESRAVNEKATKTIERVSKEYENLVTNQGKVTESTKNAANAIGDAAKGANTNAANIVAGATKGIKDNERTYTKAIKDMAKGGNDEFANTIDSHSPAKVYVGYSANIISGLVKGIADNKQSVLNSISSLAKDMGKAFEKAFTLKNISLSVSFSTWVSSDKKKVYEALGLSGWPKLNWYTYATGGFPNMGEMFIAREAGPELVGSIGRKTAVVNNDQIISGIENGVYRAMVAANSNGNSGGTQTIRIINEIDSDIVGEKVIKYHNSKVMQTGASPLLV